MIDKKVLIIDDDQAFAAVMKEGLESVGFKAAVAFDALQGVMQAHSARPDVILLDFNMPAGGGANAYERLRASTDTGRIPVVFTTATSVDEVRGQIRAGPKTFFLKKPVSLAQVKGVLNQVLGIPIDGAAPAVQAPAAAAPAPAAPTAAAASPAPTPAPAATPAPAPTPEPAPAAAAAEAPAAAAPAAAPEAAPSVPSFSIPSATPLPRPVLPPFRSFGQTAAAEPEKASASFLVPPGGAAAAAPAPAAAPDAQVPAGDDFFHQFEVRVTYGDTDRMGVIYYANYLKYFEQGRVELMRSVGIRYRDLELERKIFIPVVETRCAYRSPARYDDMLQVRTRLSRLGQASVWFSYELVDRDSGDKLVAEGYTRHAIVNDLWKPISIPDDLKQKLQRYVSAPRERKV